MEIICFENQIDKSKFYSMLSLCKRAGMLVSGEANSENAIKAKKAQLVLLSSDASKNTVKKFKNKSDFYKVSAYASDLSKEQLGGAIGESQRSVVVVTGEGFAKQLKILIKC